ncbi:MAG: hypothetical protein M1820_008108, partial [Bogoriella megaspora]
MPHPGEVLSFLRGQVFQTPPVPTTSFKDKTVIITGGNTGLGLEAAKHILRLGVSHLIIACRNPERGQTAANFLSKISAGSKISVWQLNLSSYLSVLAFADRATTELPRIDALILNAGTLAGDFRLEEGVESTLTVNVLSTFLLAVALIPKLRESRGRKNIVVVGSAVHMFAKEKEVHDALKGSGDVFDGLSDQETADMEGRYNLSKLLVIFGVREMARRLDAGESGDRGKVVLNCVAPGWCRTDLFREQPGGAGEKMALKLMGRS